MKILTVTNRMLLVPVFALACPSLSSAHDFSSTLAEPASATDYLAITCLDDIGPTEHLFFQLHGGVPASAPTVSAQIVKNNVATSVTDPVSGDSGSSRGVEVHGGGGAYYITIDKAGPGRASYSLEFHCQTASGDHNETERTILQNQ